MQKVAIVTGITGQDGSYLAELLLGKGYSVIGLSRRASTDNLSRLREAGLYGFDRPMSEAEGQIAMQRSSHLRIIEMDVTDPTGVNDVVRQCQPDEIYNLAAQSHVGSSFTQPHFTFQVDAVGPLNFLEAIRQSSPKTRFYQASTSELYGDTTESPQNERTRFKPASPYAVAKLAAHHLVSLYRKAYGIHASAGILFNHECISPTATPVLLRRNGLIDILPIAELCVYRDWATQLQTTTPDDLEIWDQTGWTRIKALTVTRTVDGDSDHRLICVNSRGGSFVATAHHKALDGNAQEIRVDAITPGSRVSLCSEYPCVSQEMHVSEVEAEFLGYMLADGWVAEDGRAVNYTKNNPELRERLARLWRLLTGGSTKVKSHASGFGGTSTHVRLNGAGLNYKLQLRQQLYTQGSFKRVPKRVLNSPSCWKAFVDAYYAGDGLKSDVTQCTYHYQSFKTNSPTLAAGIVFLVQSLTGQSFNINAYFNRDVLTYHINFHSPDRTGKGSHFRKPVNEVTKTLEMPRERFVVDIETESGTFHCGVGLAHVHNSPRRGELFVTRKITRYVGRVAKAIQDGASIPKLKLGNLDACRDWGHAQDYVEAMWLMLQQETPEDFVIATGQTRTIREFLREAFGFIGIDWEQCVETDPSCLRPADVNLLCGDASKAYEKLGWLPKTSFRELVREMVLSDFRLAGVEIGSPCLV